MNWFLVALATPVLHAIANHIDKHLISKYFQGGAVGTLVLFTSIFALLAMPVIYLLNPLVAHFDSQTSLIILNGFLSLAYVIFYLYALFDDEASFVAPFFQLVPVFGFILGYFILGETLLTHQVVASLLIIFGAMILAFDIGNKFRLKKKLLVLMLSSSLLYAASGVIFKLFSGETDFSTTLFWNMAGQVLLGLILFILVRSYRTQFIAVIRENTLSILGLNLLNGLIILAGDIFLFYALLLAPVALVLSVSGVQPLFVFIFGILLTRFLPSFGAESMEKKVLTQKIIGILVIVLGGILIN